VESYGCHVRHCTLTGNAVTDTEYTTNPLPEKEKKESLKMEKRERDISSQQLSYTEKRRCVAHLYNNKFSATLYRKTEKGEKKND
jgi:hypothetical protein